jgi:hypothetical protein
LRMSSIEYDLNLRETEANSDHGLFALLSSIAPCI